MYRPDWWDVSAEGRNILNIALDIHMFVTGSSNICTKEDICRDYEMLKYALSTWKDNQMSLFDNSVRLLILSSVKEFEEYFNDQNRS